MNKVLFYEYILHKQQFLENDYIQLKNNVNQRECDMLDHLEFIIARCRMETADEIFFEMTNLFNLQNSVD